MMPSEEVGRGYSESPILLASAAEVEQQALRAGRAFSRIRFP